MTDRPAHPVYRRRRSLTIGIVAYLADQERPTPWDELVELFATEKLSWKTVENTVRDLENFGALHRIGKTTRGADSRALTATELGRAWLAQETPPLPGQTSDDVDDELDDLEAIDPFALADEIADHAAHLDELAAHLPDPLAPPHQETP